MKAVFMFCLKIGNKTVCQDITLAQVNLESEIQNFFSYYSFYIKLKFLQTYYKPVSKLLNFQNILKSNYL